MVQPLEVISILTMSNLRFPFSFSFLTLYFLQNVWSIFDYSGFLILFVGDLKYYHFGLFGYWEVGAVSSNKEDLHLSKIVPGCRIRKKSLNLLFECMF